MKSLKIARALLWLVLFAQLATPFSQLGIAQQSRWSALLGVKSGPGFISPAIGELDGNSENGKEVVAATKTGDVYAFSASGQLLWNSTVPSYGCSELNSNDRLHSSPAIGVLRSGQNPAVVIGYGSMGILGCDGGAVAFNGLNGQELWHFSVRDHSQANSYFAFRYSTVGSPAISPYLEHGKAVIALGSLSHMIYLLEGDGAVRYYYQASDTIFSSPSFFRDSNRKRLLAIGQDISGNSRISPPTRNGGYLNVFALRAPRRGGLVSFRRRDTSRSAGLVGLHYFNQVIQSSPQVEEITNVSPGPEIALTSGCFFPQGSSIKTGAYVYLMNQYGEKLLARYPLSSCSATSPAVFGAEKIIVVLDNGLASNGGPGSSRLIGLRIVKNGSKRIRIEKIWERPIGTVTQWQSAKEVRFSDGSAGVAYFANQRVSFVQAVDGIERGAVVLDGSLNDGSLTVADMDNDGRLEVAAIMDITGNTRLNIFTAP